MKHSMRTIQSDFDKIALLSSPDSDHNNTYYNFLLKQVPPRCKNSLEIGCGTGAFSRFLAARSDRVLAIDLSPNMIRIAEERSLNYPNIEFQTADATALELDAEGFDCIVSIATLHHLPLEKMLSKMKAALTIDGTLVIHDLFQSEGLSGAAMSALAVPASLALRLIKSGRLRPDRKVREAWAEHGRHDSYLTVSQVRRVCAAMLPGAIVKRHLLWRYSMIWKKESTRSED
jgi:ubiquinone/menaquinone biosynthesis C-methylase UbiE